MVKSVGNVSGKHHGAVHNAAVSVTHVACRICTNYKVVHCNVLCVAIYVLEVVSGSSQDTI